MTKACGLVPPLKVECQSAIKAFFDPLMAKIDAVQPKTVCVKVGVCLPADDYIANVLLPAPVAVLPGRPDILGVAGGRSRQLADIFGGIGPVLVTEEKDEDRVDDGKIRIGGAAAKSASMSAGVAGSSSSHTLTMHGNHEDAVSGDAACVVCTYLVDDMKEMITTSSKAEVKALLMAGCSKLPVKQRDECIEFMMPMLENSLDFLVKIPAKEICQVAKVRRSLFVFACYINKFNMCIVYFG